VQGVAENFIGILRDEERWRVRSMIRLAVFLLVVVLLAGLIADLPERGALFGLAAGLAIIAGVVGLGLGILWGRFVTTRRYRTSLLAAWNQWMRYSVACNRVEEVHRRVRGRPAVRSIGVVAGLWAVVLFVTTILVVVTLLDPQVAWNQAPVFVFYAGLLGFLIGERGSVLLWVHSLLSSLDDLVRRGEVALWGVL
jgi:hypothetical protein